MHGLRLAVAVPLTRIYTVCLGWFLAHDDAHDILVPVSHVGIAYSGHVAGEVSGMACSRLAAPGPLVDPAGWHVAPVAQAVARAACGGMEWLSE